MRGAGRPERLPVTRLRDALRSGALIVDTRHAADYAAAHIPGTLNIPLNNIFTTWAGWLLPYDRDFYLIINEHCAHCVDEATRDLVMIGLDRVAGYFGSAVVDEWRAGGDALESVPQMTAQELSGRLRRGEAAAVIDVRGRAEWDAGHLPFAEHVPLGDLAGHVADMPRDTPLVVHCQTGGRSAIAASLLRARGFTNVSNLTGGFAAWHSAGLPTEGARAPQELHG